VLPVTPPDVPLQRLDPAELLWDLNEPQRRAVTHRDGPLLVVAGAGSGKTRVLTRRIAHLVATGDARPEEILAITFTNKAASEMRSRLVELLGPGAERMWVSTFHSACVRILRAHATRLGYRPGFSIYDDGDSRRLVEQIERELGVDTKRLPPRSVQAAISAAKAELLDPPALAERALGVLERRVAEIYGHYQRQLLAASAMDFDDLLVRTVELFRGFPDVLQAYRQRFGVVLVDEYQDTNRAQNELVVLLAAEHRQLCAVGDLDQAIYGWRGANLANLAELEQAFPGTTVIPLEQNYRSTKTILDAANAVIAHNRTRVPKRLWTDGDRGERIVRYRAADEHDEAAWVAAEIRRLAEAEGASLGDVAVFFRTNAQSRVLEEALVRAEVPYLVVGGTRFYDRKEVRDVLAYLRVVVNPADEVALRRVLNVPRRGLGDTSVAKLAARAAALGQPLAEVLGEPEAAGVSGPAARGARSLFELLGQLRQLVAQGLGPGQLVTEVVARTGYDAALAAEDTLEARGRRENLAELAGAAGAYPSLEEFLASVALVADVDELQQDAARVSLMTLHAAKGLEFPVVFLVGLEEGVFPHARTLDDPVQLEEERRLCYVGITRARQRLYLTHAWSRTLFGTTSRSLPSRFLTEIPDELVRDAPGGHGPLRGGWSSPTSGRGSSFLGSRGGLDEVESHFGDPHADPAAAAEWDAPEPEVSRPRPPSRARWSRQEPRWTTGDRASGGSASGGWARRSPARRPGRLPKLAEERFRREGRA